MFSPVFYDTDDIFGHHRPQRQRYYQQGSVDEYLRRKEQEELEAAYARRRRRELYEQQLYERRRQQAMAQRQRELMERKRRQRMLQQQMQAETQKHDDQDDYQIEIVRGRDGNLYYVKRPVRTQQDPKTPSTIIEENNHRSSIAPKPDPVIEEEVNSDSETDNEEYSNPRRRQSESNALPRQLEAVRLRHNRSHSRKKSPKRRITVTVEDASDSECESEFDSPWRNRRPSPGQWMEPVDPFYG